MSTNSSSGNPTKSSSHRLSFSTTTSLRLAWLLLLGVCLTQLVLCPYSKVEESFGLQAVHDLYYHGITPAIRAASLGMRGNADETTITELPYDHLEYPGVVPRSFVGPVVIATLCRGTQFILRWINSTTGGEKMEMDPMTVQFVARLWLLLLYLHAWYHLATVLEQQEPQQAPLRAQESTSTKTIGRLRSQPYRCFSRAGMYVLLITASQFHLTFYSSRFLSNVMATILTCHAWAFWMKQLSISTHQQALQRKQQQQQNVRLAAICLIVTTAVFRCDVLLLLFTAGLAWLYQGHLTVTTALRLGILTGIFTLAATVPLDSVMWNCRNMSPLWPEGYVFYYNAILGKSENWGTSPWYWYLTSALPKALLGTLLLLPLCFLQFQSLSLLASSTSSLTLFSSSWLSTRVTFDTTYLPYAWAFVGYIALYSCLGHKEVRFLFPVLPAANALAAVGVARLHEWSWGANSPELQQQEKNETYLKKKKNDDHKHDHESASSNVWQFVLRRFLHLAVCALLVANFAISTKFVAVSRHNYPGGVALENLAEYLPASTPCRIYIDTAAAMTGVSLFGQRAFIPHYCTVVKAGYEEDKQLQAMDSRDDKNLLTHMITEDSLLGGDVFERVATIPGNPRWNWRRATVETSNALYVLQRKS